MGTGGIAPPCLTSALHGSEFQALRSGRFPPWGNSRRYSLCKRLRGVIMWSHAEEEGKIICRCWKPNRCYTNRTVPRPDARQLTHMDLIQRLCDDGMSMPLLCLWALSIISGNGD
jgi:hypothetical protein